MARLDLPRPTGADAIAGASVAMVLVPQSLAYAELAGLPPWIGLFAAALPPLAFSLFASSPFLQTGPTAVTSLLTFAALPLAEPEALPGIAALLALMVGVLRFTLGLFRIGRIVRVIAMPVVMGFTSGAAVLIITSQLPRALGVEVDRDRGVVIRGIAALFSPGSWELAAIVLSIVTIALFVGGRKLSPLIPGVLFAVLIGTVWSAVTGYDGATVGDVPEGLPPIGFDLPWDQAGTIALAAIVIAVIGFLEPISIARTFANETGQHWDANREFMASGIANSVSAIAGGYPVGGSFSRSSLNFIAGAKTRWSGGFTGLIVLAFLPFAGLLSDLPTAVLSAIVLGAVAPLVRPRRLWGLWSRSPVQAALTWITAILTVALAPRVERAVIAGIVLAGVAHFVSKVNLTVTLEQGEPGAATVITPSGFLWFGSDADFDAQLQEAITEATGSVIIDFDKVPFIDVATLASLRDARDVVEARGAEFSWRNVPVGGERMISKLGT